MVLLDQIMRVHMAVKTVGHLLVHDLRMGFSVAGLTFWHIGMLAPVAESAGKRLMLGLGFSQLFKRFLMACGTEVSWCGQGILYLQGMMGRMATKTVTGHLAFGMGLVTICTIRDLAMHLVTEGAGLLGMGTTVIGKILPRPLMTGQAGFLDIPGKV